jgi:BirA family biotin operon repressor/biotin-[acetyl-CoA-carboxylase] ligase
LWTAGGDADASGLRVAAAERCTTIGRAVRAELPGGSERSGVAVGIDRLGRLEVRDDSGRVEPVAAGDIIHLR